jgi:hypothetical protein
MSFLAGLLSFPGLKVFLSAPLEASFLLRAIHAPFL